MEHTRLKSDNNVLYKFSVARTVKQKNFVLPTFLSFFRCPSNPCNSKFCGQGTGYNSLQHHKSLSQQVRFRSQVNAFVIYCNRSRVGIEFLNVLQFSLVRIIPPVICILFHFSTTKNMKLQQLTSPLEKKKSPYTLNAKAQQYSRPYHYTTLYIYYILLECAGIR